MDDSIYQEFKQNNIFERRKKQIDRSIIYNSENTNVVHKKRKQDLSFRKTLEDYNRLNKQKFKTNKNFVKEFHRMSNRNKALILYAILNNVIDF